jgi:DNA replication and repair protein RecF
MNISKITLTNFRNWEDKTFDLSERVLIYGPNARGKTNILEALYLVATTSSFRGRDAEVVKSGKDFMRINASIQKGKEVDVELVFKKTEGRVEKEHFINNKKRPSIDFIGEFSAIIFSPEDIALIAGTPEMKRRYLSFTIGQKDKEYLYDLLNYKRVLKQRNELLRRCDLGRIKEEIDIWDAKLAEYGERVVEKRRELEGFVNKIISEYYQKLSGEGKTIEFKYEPAIWSESFLDSLRANRDRDLREKTTTTGPHRDSWSVSIDGEQASSFASRGESRTVILALKLCERDWFRKRGGEEPVILLDDVFSELDESRRKYLIEAFLGSQIIMTTTDLEHLDKDFLSGTQLVKIDSPVM